MTSQSIHLPSNDTRDTRPVFGYVRVSTNKQETLRQESTLPQRHATLPDGLDSNPLELFYDDGISAWSGKARPGFEEMLTRIKTGEASALIVDTSSRLTRQGIRQALSIFFDLQDAATRLFTTQGREYTFDLGGIISLIVDAEADNRYSATLSHNTRSGKATKTRAGQWVHGLTPVGYRRNEEGKLEATADLPLITEMFERFLANETYRTIAAMLSASLSDEALDKTKHGRVKHDHLLLLLKNPVYAGFLPLNGELLPGSHTPAVSVETYDRAQRKLSKRSSDKTKPPRSWPFAGTARCGTCNRAMGFRSVKARQYGYLRCQNADCADHERLIVASTFEANVLIALASTAKVIGDLLAYDLDWATTPDESAQTKRDAKAAFEEAHTRLGEMTALVKQRAITTEDADFLAAVTHRDVAEAEYERLLSTGECFREALAALSSDVESLAELAPNDRASRMRMDYAMITNASTGRVLTHHTVQGVLDGWLQADFDRRRQVISTALDAIYVDRDELRLQFRSGLPTPITQRVAIDPGGRAEAAELRHVGFGVCGTTTGSR